MAGRLSRRGNATIILAGLVLGLLLAAVIGLTALGQVRLRTALLEQGQTDIEQRAAAIGLFLSYQRSELRALANSPRVGALFADDSRGRSVANAPKAGLKAVTTEFEDFLGRAQWQGQPVFSRLELRAAGGRILLERGDPMPAGAATADPQAPNNADGGLRVWRSDRGAVLTLAVPVRPGDAPPGRLFADIRVRQVMQPLLEEHGQEMPSRFSALVGPADLVIAGSDGFDWDGWPAITGRAALSVLRSPVAGTDLAVVTLNDTGQDLGFVNPAWWLAALALVALTLALGITHVLRLHRHNLSMRTRLEAAQRKRSTLREQNTRLQREIDKRLESERQLTHQANYDQLTGLPNRNLAMDRLAQAIKWARREGGSVLVLFIDLDRFKQVNDSLGHAAGDDLLREAARRLQSRVRESDTVSRLGGDEFVVICPEMPLHSDWEHRARQMLRVLSAPFYIGDHEFFVGASIGVAAYPDGGQEPERLLKNADIAMYAAKDQGRNRYCYYDPSMDAIALEGVRLENCLRQALPRGEFRLLYQPIVDLSSGETVAVEALLRWHSSELGEVPTEKFMPIAEETGLIHEIGEWVLTEACRNMSGMLPHHRFRVAVNLTAKQFSRPGRLLDCVLQALRVSGLMPSQLELEITESILIDDQPEISNLIHQLDRIGVRLSIDDFGTGYSALNYLQRFPFDVLKIDRSFTTQLPACSTNSAQVRAIIAMAHALGLEVVAEGVETREQAGFLLIQHCEYGQGYLYSRPLTTERLGRYLGAAQAIPA